MLSTHVHAQTEPAHVLASLAVSRSRCSSAWPSCLARRRRAAPTRVTFVLFNDIYLMGEQPLPDGKRRGGFARLAAVVKAERAKRARRT